MALRTFFLNSVLTACLVASNVGRPPFNCVSGLSNQPGSDFSFEESLPDYPDSLRGQFPKVYAQIRRLKESSPSASLILAEGALNRTPYLELIEHAQNARNSIARGLRKLANELQRESSKALGKMQRKGRGDDAGNQRAASERALHWEAILAGFADAFSLERPIGLDRHIQHLEWRDYRNIKDQVGKTEGQTLTFTDDSGKWDRLAEWIHRLDSLWGVVRLAAVLPGVRATGVSLGECSGKRQGLPRYPIAGLTKEEKETQIDLMLLGSDGKPNWGIVISLPGPLRLGTTDFQSVQRQAERLSNFRSTLSPLTQIRFFFINGVSYEARAALDQLGVGAD
jgi:hypothetical protein